MSTNTHSSVYCQQYLDKIQSLALPNKYTRWYLALCTSAIGRVILNGRFDRHHIVPRSLHGADCDANVITLTLREHFVAHLLLSKMFMGDFRYKMVAAAVLMSYRSHCSRRYAALRLERDLSHGKRHSQKLKQVHANNPEIQIRRKATMAAKPRLQCDLCPASFKSPVHLQKHACFSPKNLKISKAVRAAQMADPKIQAKRLRAIAANPTLTCGHCGRCFKHLGRWRKHIACKGNPDSARNCEVCQSPFIPHDKNRFCSRSCATTFSNHNRVRVLTPCS
jgi:hypothetical protein